MCCRLTVEQVEELWQCLVVRGSSECADCLYSWLLSHTKSPEQHALGLDALRFLYIEKMPTLDPEVNEGWTIGIQYNKSKILHIMVDDEFLLFFFVCSSSPFGTWLTPAILQYPFQFTMPTFFSSRFNFSLFLQC